MQKEEFLIPGLKLYNLIILIFYGWSTISVLFKVETYLELLE